MLMKKFTLFAIAALISVVAFAQKPNQFLKSIPIPFEQTQLKAKAVSRQATVRKTPRRSLGLVTPPETAVSETYYTASGKLMVNGSNGFVDGGRESIQVIVDGTDIYIAGLAYYVENAWIKGTIDGTTATFPASQQVDDDESYPEWISASDDGQTICDVVFNFDQEAGVLECTNTYIGECAVEDAFSIYAYWTQPTFTKEQPEGPQVIEAPDGLETEEYAVSARNYKDDADVSGVWQIGFDGNDVYVQGMCSYIPDAWAKGTLEGTTITFASGQYFGSYSNYYDMFLNTLLGTDVVFDYDADAGILTAQNEVFLTDNDEYYFDSYRNAVIKKVVEQAAMPANPAITSLTNGQYGWYFNFNVPNVDVDGNGLLSSKLSYIIYTDTEGTIAPLTFTPATHSRLTEDMTEIPYGFTENYDFYDTQIYLNDLYSADWTRIGIQSIYRGGGEENATEIQWFDIEKEDTNSTAIEWVAVEQGYENAQAVTDIEISNTVAGKFEKGTNTNNVPTYYDSGTAVRMYVGNTLTITSEEPMTKIVITMADNATTSQTWLKADQEEYTYSSEDKVGTWTGEATQVVFTVPTKEEAGTSSNPTARIAKIAIYFGEEEPAGPVVLPDGVEAEAWALEGFYSDGSDGADVFRATEVAFDGTDIYVKGLAYWFEDAWLKGTIDAEAGIATFPSGQFVGEDDYGKEYMVGYDGDFCDIQYVYDAEAKTLTQETPYIMESESKSGLDEEGELAFWGLWEVSYLHAGEPMALEPVEAPEGLETETYLFTANVVTAGEDDEADGARRAEGDVLTMMSFNFNMMDDVATSDNNGSTAGDITEPLVLTEENVTLTISPADEHYTNAPNRFWGTNDGPQLRVYSGTLTVEAPEGATLTQIVFNHNSKWGATNSADSGTLTNDADAKAATWTGEAQKVVFTIGQYNEETGKYTSGNSQINSIDVNYLEPRTEEPVVDEPNYSYQMQVGFDGNDVYFKGFSDNTADMWAKGMLSEDGKTVTIPAKQYMGFISSLFSTYDYYVTAIGEDGYEDIVLNYDADTNTFTTDQTIMLNGSIFVYYPYQTFTEVVITKMPEFAATPADPSIDNYKFEGTSYPYIEFVVPAQDVDGNDILTAKLFYTVWIEEDGVEKPFVLLADQYRDVTEDMTEVPYDYDDSYDIYKGGSRFYFNPTDVISAWTKIGVQSIYYGGGERNESSIVWMENPVYDPTVGIVNVNADGKQVIYFDLQGRRVAAPAKGLYIANGKKVVIK